jgi:hypothetical protein
MAAPGVIASGAGARLQRTPELGFGERGHLLIDAQLLRRGVKGRHRRAELREQAILCVQCIAMRVEAVQRAKEDLPAHSESRSNLDDLRHLLELLANRPFIDCTASAARPAQGIWTWLIMISPIPR